MTPLPKSHAVGQTEPCRVNGEKTTITLLAGNRLRIGDDDVRDIIKVVDAGEPLYYFCSDQGQARADYGVDDFGEAVVIVFPK
jgi:hypothetical protein